MAGRGRISVFCTLTEELEGVMLDPPLSKEALVGRGDRSGWEGESVLHVPSCRGVPVDEASETTDGRRSVRPTSSECTDWVDARREVDGRSEVREEGEGELEKMLPTTERVDLPVPAVMVVTTVPSAGRS